MITEKEIELCSKWFDDEDINYYWDFELIDNRLTGGYFRQFKFYISIGDYDYEISQDEIKYRAELIKEQVNYNI